jgi:hypothetical protein
MKSRRMLGGAGMYEESNAYTVSMTKTEGK